MDRMDERYLRNFPALSPEEQERLAGARVLVAGCGGLGGFIIEELARAGVGFLRAADCDVFSVSNLNRQLLCTEENLGKSKAEEAVKRAALVNSSVRAQAAVLRLDADSLPSLLEDCDLVLDALDNVETRLLLEDACAAAGIPLIHGAISGWNAQAATVAPGSGVLHRLYAGFTAPASPVPCLAPTAAFAASVQCAEALKLLCGRTPALEGKLLLADLQNFSFHTVSVV